jgi:phage terminase small subunit
MGSDGFSWMNAHVERDGKVSGVEKRAPLVLSPRDAIHRVASLSRRLFFSPNGAIRATPASRGVEHVL